jgi:transposase
MDEVLIPVEQHGRARRLGRLLDCLPLAQERFEVVDQEILADPFGLGTDE